MAFDRDSGRARLPDRSGFAVAEDGVRLAFDVYGAGDPTIVLLPSAPIVHSRQWKAQVHYLSRRWRVVTYDGRGNGRSDRPLDPVAYVDDRMVGDLGVVMDATDTDRAVLVGLCIDGVWRSIRFAAANPERVLGIVAFGVGVPRLAPPQPHYAAASATFDDVLPTTDGWAKLNRHYWQRDYADYARFFFSEICSEPHSSKAIEDATGWALDTSVEVMLAENAAPFDITRRGGRGRLPLGRLPDAPRPRHGGHLPAAGTGPATRGADRRAAGARRGRRPHDPGPPPGARQPAHPRLRGLARGGPSMTSTTWTRALDRRRRALYISSPIGLGHAQRDVAIADELRKLHPDLEIDWLAQHPVTAVLEARGERIHPLSAELASESAHVTSESSEHDLNAFQAIRRMDEILVANFMVFHDAVEEGEYDLVVGDEAWDIDHFLHENPELKRTAFAWMTDFVGWLPMPAGGEREAFLTADYNAEMIEHVERFPRIRDRAIFVGEPDDIVPDDFGPGTAEHPRLDRAALRLQRLRDRLRSRRR